MGEKWRKQLKLIEELLNLIFPNVCGFCGKIEKSWLCDDCAKRFEFRINERIYMPLTREFEKELFIIPYEDEFRESILSYKFFDKAYMYKTFSKIILKSKKVCGILRRYDIITIVPIHKNRKSKRGYDQSELIAREIAKNIPELKYIKTLKKIVNTKKQSSLSKMARMENVKNVYQIVNVDIQNKKIILFDDIYTTGSTVNECAKVLKQNGAGEILVLTLARVTRGKNKDYLSLRKE